MPTPASPAPVDLGKSLRVELAVRAEDIRQVQQLRYRVFASELGAQLKSQQAGVDSDFYDHYCHHLLVRDIRTGAVVGSTRILTDTEARRAGGFYSESEFDLSAILAVPGRFMEIGRTCVEPAYRNGATIAVLWSGLGRFMEDHHFDYLMGCASISMEDGGNQVHRAMDRLRRDHMSPPDRRVVPYTPVPPRAELVGPSRSEPLALPPLLKAYMRLGAQVCGEPCWDPAFNVADVFVLLNVEHLQKRYVRHFLRRDGSPERATGYESAARFG